MSKLDKQVRSYQESAGNTQANNDKAKSLKKESCWIKAGRHIEKTKAKEGNRAKNYKQPLLKNLHSSNMFEILREIEPAPEIFLKDVLTEETRNETKNEIHRNKKAKKKNKIVRQGNNSELVHQKKKILPVKIFNTFQLFEDTSEEDITKLIERSKILKTPRKKLRKCKFCNHKNRKCNLNPKKCNAKKKFVTHVRRLDIYQNLSTVAIIEN